METGLSSRPMALRLSNRRLPVRQAPLHYAGYGKTREQMRGNYVTVKH